MSRNLPPGPRNGLTGLGNLRRLRADILSFMVELADEYGDCVYYRVGPVGAFQFTHPDHVREVLIEKTKAFQRPARLSKVLSKWNGNGLLLAEGAAWARQRRMVQPVFHPKRIKAYADAAVRHATALVNAHAEGDPFDIVPAMSRLTLGVICDALFGEDAAEFADRFTVEVAALQEIALPEVFALIPLPDWFPSDNKRRLRRARNFLDDVVLGIIARRRAAGGDQGDLLSMLLLAVDEEGDRTGMTDRQVRDETVTLMLGGNETTATALDWTMYLLARHPSEQQAVQQELDRVLGGRPPQADDAPALVKTEAAFKEAIRLFPPVYSTSREATATVTVGGYELRRGEQVQLTPYITQRDARWFDQPAEFLPSRFDNDAEKSWRPLAYMPFGAGPRACIGKGLAMMEGVLVLATLLARCEVELVDPQASPRLEAQVSLHPQGGLPVRLRPRVSRETVLGESVFAAD